MKKYLILLSFIITYTIPLLGQQSPEFTLYMMNPFLYNPAVAGTANYWEIRSDHRFQWVGLNNAPITNVVSAFGPHSTKDMGFGGNVYSDITGPVSTTGANGVYTYNLPLTEDIRLSMGLELGILQYAIDFTSIDFNVLNDPGIPQTVQAKIEPDATAGVYVYNSQFNAGFSANHLFNLHEELTLKEIGVTRLQTHFYLMGGYRYLYDREWTFEPGVVITKVVPAAYQFEFYGKAIYKNIFWGGLSYRTQDAISIILGYTHERKIFVGYAFDYALTDLRKYTAGSHEIVIGYNFDSIKKMAKRHR